MNELGFGKINDKELNLDVKGQGCWDRCIQTGHWVNLKSGYKAVYGCYYKDTYKDTEGAWLYIF